MMSMTDTVRGKKMLQFDIFSVSVLSPEFGEQDMTGLQVKLKLELPQVAVYICLCTLIQYR